MVQSSYSVVSSLAFTYHLRHFTSLCSNMLQILQFVELKNVIIKGLAYKGCFVTLRAQTSTKRFEKDCRVQKVIPFFF